MSRPRGTKIDGGQVESEAQPLAVLIASDSYQRLLKIGTVVRDRSELKATRQQLETERERFRYLFNNLPDAITETRFEDEIPIVESVNDAFEEIFGYNERELLGNSLNEYILPAQATDVPREIDRAAAAGESWSGEIRRETMGGLKYFLFRSVPYTGVDGDRRGFGIYTDITERKQRERRLQVLTRVLRHNLRNELTILLGYAEMLQDSVEEGRLETAANSLCRGIHSVSELSEDAREIQKTLEAKNQGQVSSLKSVVDAIADEHRQTAPEATIESDIADGLEVSVDERLRLAVSHLIENATEHTGEQPTVRVRATADDEDLLLTVEDDGPGLPDLEWDVITGNTEITQLEHGSGLGLWATKWVTESYGGRLDRVESELGGAGIQLRIPGIVA